MPLVAPSYESYVLSPSLCLLVDNYLSSLGRSEKFISFCRFQPPHCKLSKYWLNQSAGLK